MDKKKKTEIKKYEVVNVGTPSRIETMDGLPPIQIVEGDILDETKISKKAISELIEIGCLKEA